MAGSLCRYITRPALSDDELAANDNLMNLFELPVLFYALCLALAVTGQADAVVSGDRDLLDLVSHEGIPVLTPAQLLQRLRES